MAEVRTYFTTDFSGTMNLRNADNSIKSTHNFVGKAKYGGNASAIHPVTAITTRISIQAGSMSTTSEVASYSGGIYIGLTSLTYPTLRSIKCTVNMTTAQANGSHIVLASPTSFTQFDHSGNPNYCGGFQVELDPPIIKDNTMALQHSFTVSWDRFTPT